MNPTQSSGLQDRQAGDDVAVVVRVRWSAFEQLVGEGLAVEGMMQLIPERAGGFSICIWSPEMPDWPDPVPLNDEARRERDAR